MADNTDPIVNENDEPIVDGGTNENTGGNENTDNGENTGNTEKGGETETTTESKKVKNNLSPFSPWGFVEGKKFISQAEQRNAAWVDDAEDLESVGLVATAIETFRGKEAPTTNLYNICAIECPETCGDTTEGGEGNEGGNGDNSGNGNEGGDNTEGGQDNP